MNYTIDIDKVKEVFLADEIKVFKKLIDGVYKHPVRTALQTVKWGKILCIYVYYLILCTFLAYMLREYMGSIKEGIIRLFLPMVLTHMAITIWQEYKYHKKVMKRAHEDLEKLQGITMNQLFTMKHLAISPVRVEMIEKVADIVVPKSTITGIYVKGLKDFAGYLQVVVDMHYVHHGIEDEREISFECSPAIAATIRKYQEGDLRRWKMGEFDNERFAKEVDIETWELKWSRYMGPVVKESAEQLDNGKYEFI